MMPPRASAAAVLLLATLAGVVNADVPALTEAERQRVEALIKGLEDEDWLDRESAAQVLAEMGPKAKDAVPPLLALIRREGTTESGMGPGRVTEAAISALAAIGPAATPYLLEALTDDDGAMGEATAALARMGAPAVPALIEVWQSTNQWSWCRHAGAVGALASMDPIAPEAVPVMTEALESRDWSMRFAAVGALGKVRLKDAVPKLAEIVRTDPNELVRSAAARALGDIAASPDVAIPALAESLRKDSDAVCRDAVAALEQMGVAARGALPEVIRLLDSKNPTLRMPAVRTLGNIGFEAEAAVPKLKALLDRLPPEASRERGEILYALQRIQRQ